MKVSTSLLSFLILNYLFTTTAQSNDGSICLDSIMTADADNSSNITETEYLSYLQASYPDCELYATGLSDNQYAFFKDVACNTCENPESDDCCDPPVVDLEQAESLCIGSESTAWLDSCANATCADILTPNSENLITTTELLVYLQDQYSDCEAYATATEVTESQYRSFRQEACNMCVSEEMLNATNTNNTTDTSCCDVPAIDFSEVGGVCWVAKFSAYEDGCLEPLTLPPSPTDSTPVASPPSYNTVPSSPNDAALGENSSMAHNMGVVAKSFAALLATTMSVLLA